MKIHACLLLSLPLLAASAEPVARMPLQAGWAIQSSTQVRQGGEAVSTPGFATREWYKATAPTTVVRTLVDSHVYPDPNFGMNLRSIGGTAYPVSYNFSNLAFPPESPFRVSWWFRTEFKVPEDYAGKVVFLHFDGINYRANLWVNGKQLASSDKMAGAWRQFEYDVTHALKPGQPNAVALEIFPPQPDDLSITFVDWNPQPPDKNLGIWRDVYLTAGGPVSIKYPNVVSHLNVPANDKAELSVSAELKNAHARPLKGVLKGTIGDIQFSQPVQLPGGQTSVIRFTPDKFPQLRIANPKLWWPVQVGPQNLYPLDLEFEMDGKPVDRQSIRFGIREVTSTLDEKNHRLFQINGRNILIRGAGYTFDMLLRSTPEKQEAELKYVRDMNLNTVRLEGKLEDDHFLELCDQMGILVLAGWCCCDHWEHWGDWKEEDYTISEESLRDQIRRLRRHPSVFDWLNGSDNHPPADVEKKYIAVLKECDWPNPYQSSATAKVSDITGETGVKMSGPYDYVAPSYWLLDTKIGGAHGFNTETSPGPAIPPIESLKQMLSRDHMWPIDSYWDYHAGGGAFRDVHRFTEALNERYGTATGLEDYVRKAQAMEYEGQRAMFEAYGRNKYTSTGVIQWMLNNAWPSIIWHLYDYYLRPGGGYFGTKKACEPLHVQYSYDDASVTVVNSYYQAFPGMKVSAKVYDLEMQEKFSRDATLDVGADAAVRAFTIPEISGLSKTYFVSLKLSDASGKPVSSNFYWLSTHPDTYDWEQSSWYHTPNKDFADLKALASLPQVALNVTQRSEVQGTDGVTHVTIENPSRQLAFYVRLRVIKAPGKPEEGEVLPVLWQDNYFPLLPGEKREVDATYRASDVEKAPVTVAVDGWNVAPRQL